MAQNPSGAQQANTQLTNRREKAKEQGLAEQNVTGASPPEVDQDRGEAGGLADDNVTKPEGDAARKH